MRIHTLNNKIVGILVWTSSDNATKNQQQTNKTKFVQMVIVQYLLCILQQENATIRLGDNAQEKTVSAASTTLAHFSEAHVTCV